MIREREKNLTSTLFQVFDFYAAWMIQVTSKK